MKSVLYFVIFMILTAVMLLPGISTVQELQKYSRNDTAKLFATGHLVTKSGVHSEKSGNPYSMFNFEGACSLNIRVNTSDSATCSKLDINNTSVSPCCNTGKWCTVPGSRINLGMRGINIITTDCSNISMDIIVKSMTCSGSSKDCEDHKRNCTGTDLPSKPVSSALTDRSTNVTDMHMTTLFGYPYIDRKSDAQFGLSDGDTIGLDTKMMLTTDANISNDVPTGSPDVINTGAVLKSLYTFVAVFGSVLLAMFLLICIYLYRTRPPKIPEILPTDELWPDSDLIQNIHNLYFVNQSPYFVNLVYFDERTDSHTKQNNVEGETVSRNHLSTLTLSNNYCSGKGNSSRPLAGSRKRNELYSDNVCALSYRKTDCKVNDQYGDGSDV